MMFGLFTTQASLSETECADRRASVLGTFCLFYQCWEDKHLAIHILKCIQLCFEQNEIPKEKTNRRKGQTAVKEPPAKSRQDSPGMSHAPRGRGGARPGGPRGQSAEGAAELWGGTAAADRHRLCCDFKHQLPRPWTRGLSVIISETETYVQKYLWYQSPSQSVTNLTANRRHGQKTMRSPHHLIADKRKTNTKKKICRTTKLQFIIHAHQFNPHPTPKKTLKSLRVTQPL